jgi:hypothetical protein
MLMNRLKKAAQNVAPAEAADRSDEIIPGTWYRDERGRMVQVISASPRGVKFYREGFSGEYQTNQREFLKFRKVQP